MACWEYSHAKQYPAWITHCRLHSRWWPQHYSFIGCDLPAVSRRVAGEMRGWNVAGGWYLWNVLILMWLIRDFSGVRVVLIVQQMCSSSAAAKSKKNKITSCKNQETNVLRSLCVRRFAFRSVEFPYRLCEPKKCQNLIWFWPYIFVNMWK